jgi:hypothetical protein
VNRHGPCAGAAGKGDNTLDRTNWSGMVGVKTLLSPDDALIDVRAPDKLRLLQDLSIVTLIGNLQVK